MFTNLQGQSAEMGGPNFLRMFTISSHPQFFPDKRPRNFCGSMLIPRFSTSPIPEKARIYEQKDAENDAVGSHYLKNIAAEREKQPHQAYTLFTPFTPFLHPSTPSLHPLF
jgi:hypothetical protein